MFSLSSSVEIQLIAIFVSVSCSILGTFLVLRKMTMMTDAISHTILLGIVIGFFMSGSITSPTVIIVATIVGVSTVYITEIIMSTNIVSEDSSIGLVFPFLFSIAIMLISRFAHNVHIDIDGVFLGELAFAPLNRIYIAGKDIGAVGIYLSGIVMIVNIFFVSLFFKELKITTFDSALSYVLGFSPFFLKYLLMSLVSVSSVAAFEAVGAILVIAFMVGPPITAYLITHDLKKMILFSVLIGIFDVMIAYRIAVYFDVSIAGTIATVIGIVFMLVLVLNPEKGVITNYRKEKKQKKEFSEKTFLFHLHHHMSTGNYNEECGVNTIQNHLKWDIERIKIISNKLIAKNHIEIKENVYYLTKEGEYHIIHFEEVLFGK